MLHLSVASPYRVAPDRSLDAAQDATSGQVRSLSGLSFFWLADAMRVSPRLPSYSSPPIRNPTPRQDHLPRSTPHHASSHYKTTTTIKTGPRHKAVKPWPRHALFHKRQQIKTRQQKKPTTRPPRRRPRASIAAARGRRRARARRRRARPHAASPARRRRARRAAPARPPGGTRGLAARAATRGRHASAAQARAGAAPESKSASSARHEAATTPSRCAARKMAAAARRKSCRATASREAS